MILYRNAVIVYDKVDTLMLSMCLIKFTDKCRSRLRYKHVSIKVIIQVIIVIHCIIASMQHSMVTIAIRSLSSCSSRRASVKPRPHRAWVWLDGRCSARAHMTPRRKKLVMSVGLG